MRDTLGRRSSRTAQHMPPAYHITVFIYQPIVALNGIILSDIFVESSARANT